MGNKHSSKKKKKNTEETKCPHNYEEIDPIWSTTNDSAIGSTSQTLTTTPDDYLASDIYERQPQPSTSRPYNATATEEKYMASDTYYRQTKPSNNRRYHATSSEEKYMASDTYERQQHASNSRRYQDVSTADIHLQHAQLGHVYESVYGDNATADVKEDNPFVSSCTIEVSSLKDNALLCAAIDIGTTYSGYAYSFQDEPENIFINYLDNLKYKTPTVLLLNSMGQLDSFGKSAQDKYQNSMDENEHLNWYLFQRFKMRLYKTTGFSHNELQLEDITGKRMPAMNVFGMTIAYMKDHLLTAIADRPDMIAINKNTDIHWVITVPAIWNDLSKVFMRKAAASAGIPDEMLTLALEPEAASLNCQVMFGPQGLQIGCRFMVLDIGGGTVDITCHEVDPDRSLKELHQPTGGDFGGTTVDKAFLDILNNTFGEDVVESFKTQNISEYLELLETFEVKKRGFDGSRPMTLQFPMLLHTKYEQQNGDTVQTKLNSIDVDHSEVGFRLGKMIISVECSKKMFDTAINSITGITTSLLNSVGRFKYIFLAGGFSESPYLQMIMKNNFTDFIKIPNDPSLSVVKGAVLYGHSKRAISSRVCKNTYGIARMMKYKRHEHPEKKRIMIGGVPMCDDIFHKHIEIGEKVSVDNHDGVQWHEYFPTLGYEKQAVLEVYASSEQNPKFIDDDGCQLVGVIKLDIDPQGDKYSKIQIRLLFGGTELIVEVLETKRNQITQTALDFWG